MAILQGSCSVGSSMVRPSGSALAPCQDPWTAWASLAQPSRPSLDMLSFPAGTGLASFLPSLPPLFVSVFDCSRWRPFWGGGVVSGFCHFGLVLFMVLWQSPDTPIMSAFSCERAASSVLESRALSSACLVSCWSVVFGSRHSCL